MKTITVKASTEYKVYIEKDLLCNTGKIFRRDLGGTKVIIITDSNVDGLYVDQVIQSLESESYDVFKYVIEAGESNKNLNTISDILSFMAEKDLSRKDIIVALGGGVVGDAAGFVAAIYMRGIDYVQIPTTILAAVDSSVGGKTAVNIPEGKNLAGAFHQPKAVICDTRTFDTLPQRQVRNGFAEIIKYGVIRDEHLLDRLGDDVADKDIADMVESCVRIKAEIVQADEEDRGIRQILNFGHSIGHAVEKLSNFQLLHGEAVACGMVEICRIGERLGYTKSGCRDRIIESLEKVGLSGKMNYRAEEILAVMRRDKKTEGDSINLILPIEIGNVIIKRVSLDQVEALLR